MAEKQEQPLDQGEMSVRCQAGCGFYGSATTNNYCSKCWKESCQLAEPAHTPAPMAPVPAPAPPAAPIGAEHPQPAAAAAAAPAAVEGSASQAAAADDAAAAALEARTLPAKRAADAEVPDTELVGAGMVAAMAGSSVVEMDTSPRQKNRKRCHACSKKVGLTAIECKCKLIFCSLHRYPEAHACTFDFKADDRRKLERLVVGGGAFSKVERL